MASLRVVLKLWFLEVWPGESFPDASPCSPGEPWWNRHKGSQQHWGETQRLAGQVSLSFLLCHYIFLQFFFLPEGQVVKTSSTMLTAHDWLRSVSNTLVNAGVCVLPPFQFLSWLPAPSTPNNFYLHHSPWHFQTSRLLSGSLLI